MSCARVLIPRAAGYLVRSTEARMSAISEEQSDSRKTYHVLFLSQRNSARSILAEAILNAVGGGRFRAYSAGVRPVQDIDPIVLELLEHAGHPTEGLRTKHFDEFVGADHEPLD